MTRHDQARARLRDWETFKAGNFYHDDRYLQVTLGARMGRDCLEETVNTRWRFVGGLLRYFSMNPTIAANPRFQALMKRVGLPP